MKSKIQIISLLFCLIFVVFSCKKKESVSTSNPSTPSEPDPLAINGLFQSVRYYTFNYDTLKLDYVFKTAVIFDTLVARDSVGYAKGIDVGNISANNIVLRKQPNINVHPNTYSYDDTSYAIINKPFTWAITGNTNFTPCNFYDEINFPSFLGYQNLLDTLYANISNTVLINSYYGAEKIEVIITSGSNNIYKTIIPPATSIVYTQNEINQLQWWSNQPVWLRINFIRDDFKKVGNKIYQINTSIYFLKTDIYYKQ